MLRKLLALFLALMLPMCTVSAATAEIPAVERNFLYGYMPQEYTPDLGITADQLEELKAAIFTAAKEYRAEVDLRAFEILYTDESVTALSSIIAKDDHEVFHIDVADVRFSVASYEGTRYLTKVKFTDYAMTQEEYAAQIAACEAAAEKLMSGLSDELTDVQKLLILHDRLAVHCEYDYDNLQAGTLPDESFTIYGALVNRVAVCEGYAKAYGYMLDKLGIENYLCSSSALNHMWNIVKAGGEYYHVDVTYDDPVNDILGRVNHNYFLRSTAGMKQDGHNANDYNDTPNDTTYDEYFWQASETAFQAVGSTLYYIDHIENTLNSWKNDTTVKLRELSTSWPAGGYNWGNNSRLSSDGTDILYSLADKVMLYSPTGDKTVYTPDLSEHADHSVFGFAVVDGNLCCDIYSNPNAPKATKRITAPYEKAEPVSIEIKQAPHDTGYFVGEVLNTEGLLLQVNYQGGATEIVREGFTVSGYDSTLCGEQTVTVTYEGLTVQYTVTVRERTAELVYGEINGDGNVDSTDARLVLQYFVGTIAGAGLDMTAADVNGDNKVDSTDARLILQYFVGSIPQFPRAA